MKWDPFPLSAVGQVDHHPRHICIHSLFLLHACWFIWECSKHERRSAARGAPPHFIFSHLFDRDHFPPLFCSKNRTFFLTTGSYFSIERGREARGRTIVRKKPVMAMLMRRTAIVRDFSMTGTLVSLWFQRLRFKM
jgi:hypothetical protein